VTLFLCETAGARIFATNIGISQVGTEYQADFTTWDIAPMGEVGDVLFRSVDLTGTMTNGASLGITPIVDGVNQTEQQFSLTGSGEWSAQAFLSKRGTRLAARVRTLSRGGDLEVHNVTAAYVPVRRVP